MGILASIFLFVILSINAACDGDFSGLEAIGKFLLYAGVVLLVCWALMNPVVLLILVLLIVVVLCASSQK